MYSRQDAKDAKEDRKEGDWVKCLSLRSSFASFASWRAMRLESIPGLPRAGIFGYTRGRWKDRPIESQTPIRSERQGRALPRE
jgi:hypothetical protein